MMFQEEKDQQWKRAMDYLSAVSELNYMTQIVIMLYEDNNKVHLALTVFSAPLRYRINISKLSCPMFCLSGDHVVSKEFFKEMWQLC